MERDPEVHVHALRIHEAVHIRVVERLDAYDVRARAQAGNPERAVGHSEVADEHTRLRAERDDVRALHGCIVQAHSPRDDASVVPDITAHANAHWSGYLLLAIYVGSQLASTYFMSTTMDKTQRTMMMVLPIAFVPVLVNFPVGLVIYWVTTNLWTVGQGLITRKLVPKKPPPAPKRSSRTPPKEVAAENKDGAEPKPIDEKPADPAQPRRVKRKKKKARR